MSYPLTTLVLRLFSFATLCTAYLHATPPLSWSGSPRYSGCAVSLLPGSRIPRLLSFWAFWLGFPSTCYSTSALILHFADTLVLRLLMLLYYYCPSAYRFSSAQTSYTRINPGFGLFIILYNFCLFTCLKVY